MSAWLWLLLAGVFEIGMTTGLKLEQHDPQYLWLFLGCAIVSFECLAKAIRTIPLGLAYAIWTGIGVADRLVRPIRLLISAADEVSEGKLTVSVPVRASDGDVG